MCDVMMNYVIWRWLISYIFVTTAAAAAAAAYCKLICWCFPRICSAFILVQYGYIVHIFVKWSPKMSIKSIRWHRIFHRWYCYLWCDIHVANQMKIKCETLINLIWTSVESISTILIACVSNSSISKMHAAPNSNFSHHEAVQWLLVWSPKTASRLFPCVGEELISIVAPIRIINKYFSIVFLA